MEEESVDLHALDVEADDALSLRHLSIHGDAPRDSSWEYSSPSALKEDQSYSSSLTGHDQDLFEFVGNGNEESSHVTLREAGKVVFCGKTIALDEPLPRKTQKHEQTVSDPQWESKGVPWSSEDETEMIIPNSNSNSNSGSKPAWQWKDYGFKSGVWIDSSTKSRRRWLLFGVPRVSTEMDMSGIRFRQSRQSPSFQGEAVRVRRKSADGLWGVVRVLGCGVVPQRSRSPSPSPSPVAETSF